MAEIREVDVTGYEDLPFLEDLLRYYKYRTPVCTFLEGVLSYDLKKVISHGDEQAMRDLKRTFHFIYNRLPAGCQGNRENVERWITDW